MDKKSVDMKKKEISFDFVDNRSEIAGKANYKKGVKSAKKGVKADLEQTMAINTVDILKKVEGKKATMEEKRSEIVGKYGNSTKKKVNADQVSGKKIKTRKIRKNNVLIKEDANDITQENVENVSLAMIAMLVLFCVVVCFVLGYMLYKIALTNSDTMAFIFRGLWF